MSDIPPHTARVLVQMHHLLRHAGAAADHRTRASQDLDTAALANNLTYACDQVFHLIPAAYRTALLHRPDLVGADPVQLARQALRLAQSRPGHHFPAGMASVVELLGVTVRNLP